MGFIIRGATLSYPNLFVPKLPMNAKPGAKARYNCMGLIPLDCDITAVQQATFALMQEKWGERTQEMIANGLLKWPFRKDNMKQDGSRRFDPEKFKCFISPWSETQPGLVDRYAGPDGKPLKITPPSQTKFYPGCVVNISVNPFVFDNSGNRGAGLGLQNIQFWEDGARLDNRVAAEDEFQAEARPSVDLAQVEQPGAAGSPDAQAVAQTGPKGQALANLFA